MQNQIRPLSYLLMIPIVVIPLYTLLIVPTVITPTFDLIPATLIGQCVLWSGAIVVVAGVIAVENRPLTSIGWQHMTIRGGIIAIGIGIVLSLLVPVLTLLISAIIPGAEEEGTIAQVTETVPAWLIFISVLTAAVTEEILYRGYLIERLLDLTGHKWFSGAISVFVFVLVHAAGWNWQHVFGVVLPLGIILTALYLWRRNLFFVMIVHLVINLPLVFLAQ